MELISYGRENVLPSNLDIGVSSLNTNMSPAARFLRAYSQNTPLEARDPRQTWRGFKDRVLRTIS